MARLIGSAEQPVDCMKNFFGHISLRSINCDLRKLATCAIIPVLLLSSVTSQAILVHDHHGHETHSHIVASHDLDQWEVNSEHQHDDHEHDGQPADPTKDEDNSMVVEFELPVALPGSRVVSTGVVVSNTVPSMILVAISGMVSSKDRPHLESQTSCARIRHARSAVVDILLTNHAILL